MLRRKWGEESNGKLPHLFIPSKTATLVPEFFFCVRPAFGQNCSLGSWVCSEKPALGHNTLIWWWTQWFCFTSLLSHNVKFVKWRLQCISHFVLCYLQLQQSLKSADLVTRKHFWMKWNLHWQIITIYLVVLYVANKQVFISVARWLYI